MVCCPPVPLHEGQWPNMNKLSVFVSFSPTPPSSPLSFSLFPYASLLTSLLLPFPLRLPLHFSPSPFSPTPPSSPISLSLFPPPPSLPLSFSLFSTPPSSPISLSLSPYASLFTSLLLPFPLRLSLHLFPSPFSPTPPSSPISLSPYASLFTSLPFSLRLPLHPYQHD